jgi:hypothetical protein
MWLAFAAIIILCCIDYVYLSEGVGAIHMSDSTRKIAHLVILGLIVPVGYMGWYAHPMQWIKKVWLWTHILSLALIIGVGIFCYAIGYHDKVFLKKIGDFRLFFCSPVPYFMLYVLSVISKNLPQAVQK